MKRLGFLIVPALLLSFAAAPGVGSSKTSDSIWIVSPAAQTFDAGSTPRLVAGDRFSAGWRSSKISTPWGLAQCWENPDKSGVPFFGEWRTLQSDGTIGVFDAVLIADGARWPAQGATCNVSLVSLQGNKRTVTATSADFFVGA